MTIPNIITAIRFCLVPVFPIVYYSSIANAHLIASIIFIFAMFLDVLDGFIARKFNMITKLGQVFDPIADKLMVMTVVSTLVTDNQISKWFLYFVLAKELFMMIGGVVIYGKDKIVIPSNVFGKLATFCMFFFLLDAMYLRAYLTGFSILVVCIMVLALVTYCVKFLNIKKNTKQEGEAV